MTIKAVVFDLDGVLIDSEHVWDEVREALASERGGRWHDRAQADMMGMSSTEGPRHVYPPPPHAHAYRVTPLDAVVGLAGLSILVVALLVSR
jgi:phosphoglycolate phosphatase-like HAD superfamily hydrolase